MRSSGQRSARLKASLCLAALLCAVVAPSAAARPARASVRGGAVFITEAGHRHRLKLPEEVKTELDDATLLAQREVNGTRYLLLYLTGPSRRSRNGMGHCGAGVESGILWLKLQDWQVADSRYRQVESCWRDISIQESPVWVDGVYVVVFWDFRDDNQEFTLRYDPERAAEGFALTSKPFN